MKIPLFWAKGHYEDREGQSFSSWQWSEVSLDDALQKAIAAAKSIAERITKGKSLQHSYYGDRPLREEILHKFKDLSGKTSAVITRNAYGCEVLNTASVMFVDVDIPPVSFFQKISYAIRKLFNSSLPHPAQQREAEALTKLKIMAEADKNFGARVYRTFAGLRYMITHTLIEPNAQSTIDAMKFLGSDNLYMKLCKAQECFRARLTPKPWRCGINGSHIKYPRETKVEEESFKNWHKKYENVKNNFASCHFVTQIGNTHTHPEIQPILKLHDDAVKAVSSLYLA